jgi:hypothetical protein
MSRPASTPSFATHPNYLTGPEVGTPTKVAPDTTLTGDGYRPGDEPGAQQFNYVINLICLWITWLASAADSITDPRFEWKPASVGKLSGTASIDNTTAAVRANAALDGSGFIPISARVGDVIDQLGLTSFGDGTHSITLSLVELDAAGGWSDVATFTRAAQPASWSTATQAITPYTVQDGKALYLGWLASGGTTIEVQSVGARTASTGLLP